MSVTTSTSGTFDQLLTRFPTTRGGSTAVWVGGQAFIFGGRLDQSNTFFDEIFRFDPGTGTLTEMTASLPTGREHPVAVWTGTKVLLFGGRAGTTHYNDILEYDPVTDVLVDLPVSLPTGLYWPAAVWTGTYAYIFGGMPTSSSWTNAIRRYDPATQTLTTLATTLPTARHGMGEGFDGTYAYVFGGHNSGTYYNTIYRFNPATETGAAQSAVMPQTRSGLTATWDGQFFFLYGGGDGCCAHTNVIRFEPATGSVTTPLTLPPRTGMASAQDPESRITYLFGARQDGGGGAFDYLDLIVRHLRSLPPNPPQHLQATTGPASDETTLTWDEPEPGEYGVTEYHVYRSTSPGGPFTDVGTVTAPTTSFVDASLSAATFYYYRVTSKDPYQESHATPTIGVSTKDVPTPPQNLVAKPIGSNVDLDWRRPVWDGGETIASYEVYSSTNNGVTYSWLASVPGTSTAFSATACNPQCYYQVTAANSIGEGDPSNPAAALPKFLGFPPESIRGTTPSAGLPLKPVFPCEGVDARGTINAVSGQFVGTTCLLEAASPFGLDVTIELTHRTQQYKSGFVGNNWDLSLSRRIDAEDNNDAYLQDGSGRTDKFGWTGASPAYSSAPGIYADLTSLPGGGHELRSRGGILETFDATGARNSIEDATGNKVAVTHDSWGRPVQIQDTAGRLTTFLYSGKLLSSIQDWTGRTILFTYDADDDLTSIQFNAPGSSSGATHEFTYTTEHNLETATDPEGHLYLRNIYEQGRVVRQENPSGAFRLTYNPGAAFTDVRDPNGNLERWSYVSAQTPLPVSKVEFTFRAIVPQVFFTTYQSNPQLEITRVTKPGGAHWEATYDHTNIDPVARENLLQLAEHAPNAAPLVTTFTYEPTYARVRSVTTPLETGTYTPPNGGTNFAGRYTTTFWYGQDEATEGDLNGDGQFEWPPSQVVRIDHPQVNANGNPSSSMDPASANQGRSETYAYNGRGQLTRHVASDGAVTLYDYYDEETANEAHPSGFLKAVRQATVPDEAPADSGSMFTMMAAATSADDEIVSEWLPAALNDASGNSRLLTMQGSPGQRTSPQAKYGVGYDLDGSTEWLQRRDMDLRIVGDLSLFVAFEADSFNAAVTGLVSMIAGGETQVTNALYDVAIMPSGAIRYLHETGSGVNTAFTSTATISPGFHTLTLRRDATANTVVVKVDGTTFINTAYTNDPNGGQDGNLCLGDECGIANAKLNGGLYEVRLWNQLVDQAVLDELADPSSSAWRFTPVGTETGLWFLGSVTPAEYRTAFTYDAAGNIATITDPAGRITTQVFDAFNRPVTVRGPAPAYLTNGFEYDLNGNLVEQTRPNAVQTTNGVFQVVTSHPVLTDAFVYDELDRVTEQIVDAVRPDGAPETLTPTILRDQYGYDANGNLVLHRHHSSAVGDEPNTSTTYLFNERDQLVATTVGGRHALFPLLPGNTDVNVTNITDPFTLYLHAQTLASQTSDGPLGAPPLLHVGASMNETGALAANATASATLPAPLPTGAMVPVSTLPPPLTGNALVNVSESGTVVVSANIGAQTVPTGVAASAVIDTAEGLWIALGGSPVASVPLGLAVPTTYHMNETPPTSNETRAGGALNNESEAAGEHPWSWSWTPAAPYSFDDVRVQFTFWAVATDNVGPQSSNTWHARLYSNDILVASTDPVVGVTFPAALPNETREYRVSLGTAAFSGSELRLELEPADPSARRFVLFDSIGAPARLELGRASTTTTQHDDDGNPLVETDGNGVPTLHAYDGFARRSLTTRPDGSRTTSTYDPAGRVVEESNYGPLGGLGWHTDPGSNVLLARSFYQYDEAGRLFRQDTARFDPSGLSTITDAGITPGDGNATTFYEYDETGRLVRQTGDDGMVQTWTYDGSGRLLKTTDGAGNEVRYAYDAHGNVAHHTLAELVNATTNAFETHTSILQYDPQDRVVRVTDPLGQTHRFGYDATGNLAWQTDAVGPLITDTTGAFAGSVNNHGNLVRYGYDAQNRLILTNRTLTSNGQGGGSVVGYVVTSQEWDGQGRLVRQTDHNGNSTSYVYDALGRLANTTYAENTVEASEYDAAGNLVRRTTPVGHVIAQDYDSTNRLVRRTLMAGPTTVSTLQLFEYDGFGRLTRAIDNNDPNVGADDAELVRAFDSSSHLLRENQNGRTVSYQHDGAGNAIVVTYPSGRDVSREFDALRRLTEITDSTGIIQTYTYNGTRLIEQGAGNGVATTYAHDEVLRLVELDHDVVGTNVHLDYTYDRMGRRTADVFHHAPSWSQQARFDSLGRLVNLTRGNHAGLALPAAALPLALATAQEWLLDGANNWQSLEETRASVYSDAAQTHTETNAVKNITKGSSTTPFTYDVNGNRLSDGEFTYGWDAFNRLRTVTNSSTSALVSSYTYDALGRRTTKIVASTGETTKFTFDHNAVVEERNATGVMLREYVHGTNANNVLAMDQNIDGDGSAIGAADTRFYYLHDALGSVVALTNETGHVREGYLYDAFGQAAVVHPGTNGTVDWGDDDTITTSSSLANTYLFTGQRLDTETGLYHYHARYYDPQTGQFLSRDPIGVWGDAVNLGNPYAYVGNNPVAFIDPDGASTINAPKMPCWIPFLCPKESDPNPVREVVVDVQADGIPCNDREFWDTGWCLLQITLLVYPGGGGGAAKVAKSVGPDSIPIVAKPAKSILQRVKTFWKDEDAAVGLGGKAAVAGKVVSRAELEASGTAAAWKAGSDVVERVAQNDIIFYRVSGGSTPEIGAWLTPVKPTSRAATKPLSLPPGNTAEYVSSVRIPAGTRYWEGRASDLYGGGGGLQAWLPDRPLNPANFFAKEALRP